MLDQLVVFGAALQVNFTAAGGLQFLLAVAGVAAWAWKRERRRDRKFQALSQSVTELQSDMSQAKHALAILLKRTRTEIKNHPFPLKKQATRQSGR